VRIEEAAPGVHVQYADPASHAVWGVGRVVTGDEARARGYSYLPNSFVYARFSGQEREALVAVFPHSLVRMPEMIVKGNELYLEES
jgi:hypothetical protein